MFSYDHNSQPVNENKAAVNEARLKSAKARTDEKKEEAKSLVQQMSRDDDIEGYSDPNF